MLKLQTFKAGVTGLENPLEINREDVVFLSYRPGKTLKRYCLSFFLGICSLIYL